MTNEQQRTVIELVLQRIKTLETFDIQGALENPVTRPQALINEKQLKDLKGWLINQKLDELGGKTMLEVAQ